MFGFGKFSYKSDSERIFRLQCIVNFDSPYAPDYDESKNNRKRDDMFSEIKAIEDSIENPTSDYYYNLDIAYRNYCSWFFRGDDKIPYFEKQRELLNKAVELDPKNYIAYAELMDILINHVQIRDLPKALEIADVLKRKNALPDYLEPSLKKAKTWSGIFDIPENIDFSDFAPTPGNFREERSYILKVYKEYERTNNPQIKNAAKKLYNLAILAGKLYGGSFVGDTVSGAKYDKAMEKHELIGSKINFEYAGRIIDSSFLSDADYKKLEKVFGLSGKTVSLRFFVIK